MSSLIHVAIHASQFPDAIRRERLASLRARAVNHKFHYDSVKQTQQWLALHQAFSPSRTDDACAATYDRSFVGAAARIDSLRVHLVGLGCGGGQKDTRLLKLLQRSDRQLDYTPSDVSTAMVLVAAQTSAPVVPPAHCHPLVCDLLTADDLPAVLDEQIDPRATRLITFFGMIPNFEPPAILPRLGALLRPGDHLLFSANLAPDADYAAGVRQVFPQYNNVPTRDWLLTFLLELGIERGDGDVRFSIEPCPVASGLQRITARFDFERDRTIRIEDEEFAFRPSESIRLFFSYRHTPESVRALLTGQNLEVLDQWLTPSGEEGVFLIRKQ